ncbi:MAG: threonine/serine dehydratase [Blastocatellia bacterium]|nr:threonine/serine dehydratase [Blastocatellia bacterium]
MAILNAQQILDAETRIRPHVRETPVDESPALSERSGCAVSLKLEHLQHTGSFKLRGATNKLLSLSAEQLERGVLAASTGNHGLGVCHAARAVGARATIYLPRDASETKIAAMRRLGGEPVAAYHDCLDAEIQARRAAGIAGRVFISPYNDLDVIAGQGTIGVELARQQERIDAVFIAVGGGGLIAGIGAYLKSVRPETRIVGCWPANARALYESLRAGRILDVPEEPTLSESTAGGVEEGSITFPLCQESIDDSILVEENEIRTAMRLLAETERWMVEGAAAVTLAALLKERERYRGQRVVLLLCGRNISPQKWGAAANLHE